MSSRDLFMKKKTSNEVEAALSFLITGLDELKQMIEDCYSIPKENIFVTIDFKIRFINCVGFGEILSCPIVDLASILVKKSEENYNMVAVKEKKTEVHTQDLEEIRRKQFVASIGIKLKKIK